MAQRTKRMGLVMGQSLLEDDAVCRALLPWWAWYRTAVTLVCVVTGEQQT